MIAMIVAEKDTETGIAITPIAANILRTDPGMSIEIADIGVDITAISLGTVCF